MNRNPAIAILVAIAVVAISSATDAAPLPPKPAAAISPGAPLVVRVQSKNGAVIRSTGALRTFRPAQISRVRPTFAPYNVRPGRPVAHRSTVRPAHLKRAPRQAIHVKRPRRPRHIHVAGPVRPDLPSAIYIDNTHDGFPYSPDVCRYWEDRGVVVGDLEPCWW